MSSMGRIKYSVSVDEGGIARAIGYELKISPKKAVEICREIRGMRLEKAKQYLEDVIAGKRAVPFRRYNRDVPHRKGKGIMSGRYPRNAAKGILKTLENAEANADYRELDRESLVIAHIAAHRGRTIKNFMPRAHGRFTPKNTHLTNIEIILKEIEE